MSQALQASRQGGEDLLEPVQSPEVALGRGLFFDVEHAGGLGAGEFFEMTQGQDFAVDGVERVQRFLEAQHPFRPHDRLGGRSVLAEDLHRQRRRAGPRQGASVQGDLSTGVAHLRAQVLPVQL